ncbi:MAG TPA: amino acid permease [Methanosarcinales archaeon]|nr:amino acid permease [Methanosarcinales archaeon]
MTSDNLTDPNNNNKETKVVFRRDLGLFDATMIGIGAMIGAGIFVLTGIAAEKAGPAAILAFTLNGILTFFTAFSYAELASAIPEAGGGYSFIMKAMPRYMGFLSGWMLWFAYTVACSLYAKGFASYALEMYSIDLFGISEHSLALLIAFLITALFVILNVLGTVVSGKAENIIVMAKVLILGVFIIFGLKAILQNPSYAISSFSPFLPNGLNGVFVAMGLTFIAFEGYDLIATVSEEVKDPEKNIPRAIFISLLVTIIIYLFIIFTAIGAIYPENGIPSWIFLGNAGETAIVEAAKQFIPSIGFLVIGAGGILSTMSALNATIIASSRVSFSMGRDRLLPKLFEKIHSQRRTPIYAVLITGFIIILMALTLPIESVASAASLFFLLTFAMVNMSVILLRKKMPEGKIKRGYKIPLYPIPPVLGVISSIGISFYIEQKAWIVGLLWIGLGIAIYAVFISKFEEEKEEEKVVTIVSEKALLSKKYHVLLPIANFSNTKLVEFASAITSKKDGDLTLLNVIGIPWTNAIKMVGSRFVDDRREKLNKIKKITREKGIIPNSMIVVSHNIPDAVLDVAKEEKIDLIILGWRGWTLSNKIFGSVIDPVVQFAPCDVAVIKTHNRDRDWIPKKILLPTGRGDHAKRAVDIAISLCKEYDSEITVISIAKEHRLLNKAKKYATNLTSIIKEKESKISDASLSEEVFVSKSIVDGIVNKSTEYDMVVLGASGEWFLKNLVFGSIPEIVAKRVNCSVIMVKKYRRGTSLLKRLREGGYL